MDIFRVQARWSGFTGSPGYSSFYFAGGGGLVSDAQQVADRVAAGFVEIAQHLPTGVAVQVESDVEVLDSDTGVLSAYQSIDPPAPTVGTRTGSYSAASGAVINWNTQDVRFGRRIRGRTFLVPLSNASYDEGGTLSASALTQINDMADTIRGTDLDSEFGVWSRPRNGAGGVFATVTGHRVPDMAAVLRSRRD